MDGVDQLNAGGMHDHDPSTNVMNLPLYFIDATKNLFFSFLFPLLPFFSTANETQRILSRTKRSTNILDIHR